MLTDEQNLEAVVDAINKELNIPVLTEAQEAAGIRFVLNRIAPVIPADVLTFIGDTADGLDDTEIKKMEDYIVSKAVDIVGLPWLPRQLKDAIVRPVVEALLKYAVKGKAISFAKA